MNSSAQGAPVRVLVVHNTYQHRGGEDTVVEAEVALLRQHGHAVELYQRDNHEVVGQARWRLARDTIWSRRTCHELDTAAAAFRPDIVHVHNSFPLVSPSVYWAADAAGLPVVQTLHNFRLICPQAMLLRDGKVCEDCVGKIPWRAAVHRCYRGSVAQSAVSAGMVQIHRALGTWQRKVRLYIALNAFCRDKFIEGGLPADRIRIKANFVDLAEPPAGGERRAFLYAGRLSREKGMEVLADALRLHPQPVRVAGTGPDAAWLDGLGCVERLGALPAAELYAEMARARALLVPSIWYENFPRTVVEAYANGLPVIASRLGALSTIIEDGRTGLLFEPDNAVDLARKLQWAVDHPQAMEEMGLAARALYERELTGDANYRALMAIYDEARRPVPART